MARAIRSPKRSTPSSRRSGPTSPKSERLSTTSRKPRSKATPARKTWANRSRKDLKDVSYHDRRIAARVGCLDVAGPGRVHESAVRGQDRAPDREDAQGP